MSFNFDTILYYLCVSFSCPVSFDQNGAWSIFDSKECRAALGYHPSFQFFKGKNRNWSLRTQTHKLTLASRESRSVTPSKISSDAKTFQAKLLASYISPTAVLECCTLNMTVSTS